MLLRSAPLLRPSAALARLACRTNCIGTAARSTSTEFLDGVALTVGSGLIPRHALAFGPRHRRTRLLGYLRHGIAGRPPAQDPFRQARYRGFEGYRARRTWRGGSFTRSRGPHAQLVEDWSGSVGRLTCAWGCASATNRPLSG